MITSKATMNNFSYLRYMALSGDVEKIYIPVEKEEVIYTQFEHVSGVMALEEEECVEKEKVSALDKLIDKLINLREHADKTIKAYNELDGAIRTFQGFYKAAEIDAVTNPYADLPLAPLGFLLNFVA